MQVSEKTISDNFATLGITSALLQLQQQQKEGLKKSTERSVSSTAEAKATGLCVVTGKKGDIYGRK